MESHEATVVTAHADQEPPPPSAADDTARPAVEKSNKGASELDSNNKNNDNATKRADRTDAPEKKKHAKTKKPKKHHRRKPKIIKNAVAADSSDSSSSDTDSGDSLPSDDELSTDSDTDVEDSVTAKKKKKHLRYRTKPSKGKNDKKKSHTKHGRSSKRVDQDTSTSSSESEDADEDPYEDPPRRGLSVNDGKESILAQKVRNMQLQISQLQQLSRTGPLVPAPPGMPGYGFNNGYLDHSFRPPGPPAFGMPMGHLNAPPIISLPPPPPPPPPGRGRRLKGGKQDGSSSDSPGSRRPHSRKKAVRAEFKRVDWVWDSKIYRYKLQDTAETTNDSQYNEYIFHVRRTFDCENKYRETFVDIKSKLLRECLQDVIGNVEGVSLVDETPKIDPNLLFLYLEDFRAHRKHLNKATPAGESKRERKKNQKRLDAKRKQLKVLIKYLDKDYTKVKESLYPMLESGLITFDLLWALWKPNTLAYTTTYGTNEESRVFKVDLAERQSSVMKGEFYYIDGRYFESDGKRFGYGTLSEEINEFHGARKITSLNCYPLQYHKNESQIRAELVERGKKFVSLGGMHFKSYSGIAYAKRKRNAVMKFNIQQSRIMVDPAIFRRINPNYFVSMVRSKDQDRISDGGFSDDSDCCGCGSSEEEVKYVTKLFKDRKGNIQMARVPKDSLEDETVVENITALPEQNGTEKADDAQLSGDSTTEEKGIETPPEFTDEEYLIASPVVLGFSFSEKLWLEFRVSDIKDIKWNDNAWDSLVLEPTTKDLIQALVKSRKYNATQTIDDVIQGKGKGLVTVLHGPPGTGKTLTAEGISELLKCPLYMVSAGELGTDSRLLEGELQKILDICHAWGAILLLDEADVFLEKRDMHEIHRNALVSIFLRQLEYFQGILFLTTNRVETFDEAFQSRIHIALRYDALDSKAKKAIFKMFIERVRSHGKLQLQQFTEEDYSALAKRDLNGREIKNVVGSAQDLAFNKGEALGMRHIRQVLDVHAKFGRDLRGGTGYEDAMRSYF